MNKSVSTLFLWFVLLALPIQGMAQASMFACHLQGNSTESVQMMDHAEADHSSMMDHSMHGAQSESVPSDTLAGSLHGCCHCAPSCAVVLLPVAQVSFASIQHDALHPVSSAQLPHSADTRRIERPPKKLAI